MKKRVGPAAVFLGSILTKVELFVAVVDEKRSIIPNWFAMLATILLVLCVRAQSAVICKKNEVNFLNKCYCEPGWESKTVGTLDCSQPIIENGDCECERNDIERKFLKNESWFHPNVSVLPN